ncbi:hypothetical protein ACKI2N_032210 [Cupriavidus sp. 30B13]|uniref:hypothetical protein n=1 Tax=Cupriavidus sp. 30B13 TaxID=3384241 RepID=UPI003B8ED2CE
MLSAPGVPVQAVHGLPSLRELSDLRTSDPDALLRDAIAASQRNDGETALALLAQVSALAPHAAIPYVLAGGELAQAGRYAEAESAYARALLLDPALHIARYQLGLLQFTSGNVPMAMLSWQPLLDLGQEHPLSLFVQGFAHLAHDNMSDAARLFHQGMRANADNAPLNADIAMVLQRMADSVGETSAAVPTAETAVQPEAPGPAASAHVLLTNYQRGGSLN